MAFFKSSRLPATFFLVLFRRSVIRNGVSHRKTGHVLANCTTSFHHFCTSGQYRGSLDNNNATIIQGENNEHKMDKPFKDVKLFYDKSTELKNLDRNELQVTLRKFNLGGVHLSILQKFDVRMSKDGKSLLFPLTSLDKSIMAVHFLTRKANPDGEILEESVFPSFPLEITRSDYWGFGVFQSMREKTIVRSYDIRTIMKDIKIDEPLFFGCPQVDTSRYCLVLTSSPLDVLAIYQKANASAVAFPQDIKDFPLEIFPLLEKFKKVVLWVSNNNVDWRLSVARILGKKSFFIRSDADILRPLTSMQNELSIPNILSRATSLIPKLTPLTVEALEKLCCESQNYEGVKWKRFVALNEILKGHRKGELTIFSGHTGTGKTTFMSEYSLDLCMQGIPTLWASFEIPNERIYKTMITQFALCPLENPEPMNYWKVKFRKLKMFFMELYGQSYSLELIIEDMIYLITTYDIQHVVVDNLQFMTNVYDTSASLDIFRLQDRIFSEFRRLASKFNCHVTLVIHPKKEPESTELNNNSIFGTAKGKQEADNIIFLQTTRQRQYIQITKNRFDGSRGSFFLEFNKETLSYSLKKKQKE